QIYGFDFLSRPVVFIVLLLTIWGICAPLLGWVWRRVRRRVPKNKLALGFNRSRLNWDALFAFGLATFFAVVLFNVDGWPRGARLIPQFVAWTGILVTLSYLATRLFAKVERIETPQSEQAGHMDL